MTLNISDTELPEVSANCERGTEQPRSCTGSEIRQGSPTSMPLAMILWPERRKLLRWALVAMAICGVVAFLIPKRWESTARLMPPDQASSASSALQGMISARVGEGMGALTGDMLGVRNAAAVMTGVLASDSVQDELIDKFDLRKVYKCKFYTDARKILKKNTDISEERRSGIITIRVSDRDPVRARDMAQAYVDALNRLVVQLTTSSAHRERMFLETRIKGVKQDLDGSTSALSRFSSRTGTLNPQAQGRAMLEASTNLQGHLIAAESELSGLQQVYTPDNIRIRGASARVSELRKELNKLTGAGSPQSKERQAESSGNVYPSIRELPLLGNTYDDLFRQAKIQEVVYEALTKQYEIAKVQEAKEIPSVRVLDAPKVPERKSWPPRALMMLVGGMLGFIAAALSVLCRKFCAGLDVGDPRRLMLTEMTAFASRLKRLRPWRLMRNGRTPA